MGRRAILLLSAMATMVLVAAGVALAALFVGTTGSDPSCPATADPDQIAMGPGNDTCSALGGNDQVYGDSGNDELNGNGGNDQVYSGRGSDASSGGSGNDFLNAADNRSGNDTVNGGPGVDRCVADDGDTVRECDGRVTRVPAP
jgi:Ca2+-binding RTX toxin-like protein